MGMVLPQKMLNLRKAKVVMGIHKGLWPLRHTHANQKMNMRLAAISVVLALFFGCESAHWLSGPVAKAVKKEVRSAQKTEIHLSKLTPFEWDEAYFFDPYTPRRVICEDLGISKKNCPQEIADESTNDGEMFLVFRKSGKIVHKEMYGRFNGDFTPIDYALPLTPETAIFDVIEDGVSSKGKPWFRLKLRSALPTQKMQEQAKLTYEF